MTSPHMPPRRGREPKTPRQTNEKAPVSDEQPEQAHPDRPTSTERTDRRLRNLAESHLHEAHRLAGTQAGNTHAHIAHVYAILAAQERP